MIYKTYKNSKGIISINYYKPHVIIAQKRVIGAHHTSLRVGQISVINRSEATTYCLPTFVKFALRF